MIELRIKGGTSAKLAEFDLRQVDSGDIDLYVNERLILWFEVLNGKVRMFRAAGQDPNFFHVEDAGPKKLL